MLRRRNIFSWKRYDAQQRVARARGTGYRFGLASTCSTQVSHDVDSFSGWWKPLLYQPPGEGGREDGHLSGDTLSFPSFPPLPPTPYLHYLPLSIFLLTVVKTHLRHLRRFPRISAFSLLP